jgi:hypothetical protein
MFYHKVTAAQNVVRSIEASIRELEDQRTDDPGGFDETIEEIKSEVCCCLCTAVFV